MEWHTASFLQVGFLQSLHFICFYSSFPDGARLLWSSHAALWSGLMPCFRMPLKPQRSFLNPVTPSSLEQVEPIGFTFPKASVLGLYTPNITCLCCHGCLFGFFSAGEHTARKAFILLKRKRLNRSFLHPYDTFNSATLEIRSVGAACPGYRGRGS